ncbi:hypothetical protein F4554_003041 [Actinopolymorpha rutila]|uniref:Uncharacterized protein n=1 Tax=Actinopolymorpha rutila TaxID=446787 RepID=A0A852ZDL9_9ACTN|nr:hypothetical protein [Actinopolymorpha rutila]
MGLGFIAEVRKELRRNHGIRGRMVLPHLGS